MPFLVGCRRWFYSSRERLKAQAPHFHSPTSGADGNEGREPPGGLASEGVVPGTCTEVESERGLTTQLQSPRGTDVDVRSEVDKSLRRPRTRWATVSGTVTGPASSRSVRRTDQNKAPLGATQGGETPLLVDLTHNL